ncbi:MAG: FAD-linked oxidase C-terminal domain-containing protein [Fuerstiella sp.]
MSDTTAMPLSVITPKFQLAVQKAISPDRVLNTNDELLVYECDGYVVEKNTPDIVVFPETSEEIQAIVRICRDAQVPFVPRGAGTSLAGGCLPVGGGVMISLTRMNQILELAPEDRLAVVQPGVINSKLNNALKNSGFHFAPDPSSQGACTLGGNVATNSGGPHTLKYGVTVNHVLGIEFVSPEGEIIQLGGPLGSPSDFDYTGLFVGSEGTFGIVTKIWVKLTQNPPAVRTMLAIFDSIDDTTAAISAIIAAGIIPAALEMIDQGIIGALEDAFAFGFPLDAAAVLLIEVDGLEIDVDEEAETIANICREHLARDIQRANDDQERALLWKCRKQAFGAIGRLSPSYCTQDGVVPRTKVPEILRFIADVSKRHDIRILNVFHAGDGNLHPILLFDERDHDQVQRVLKASDEILSRCIELGGSVTGEHGIGVEKIDFMKRLYSDVDLAVMNDVRAMFNPQGLCSPGKLLPTTGACGAERITVSHPGRKAAM